MARKVQVSDGEVVKVEEVDAELMEKIALGSYDKEDMMRIGKYSLSTVDNLIKREEGKPPILESFKEGTRTKVWKYKFHEHLYNLHQNNG